METITSTSGRIITFRPPKLSNIKIMLEFINEIGREDIYVNVNPANLYTFAQEEQFVIETVEKINKHRAVFYLAFDDESLIGTCSLTLQIKRRSHIGVFGITIKKEYREDGIGRSLADFVIKNVIDILKPHSITLKVFAPNNKALNLYKELGFHEYGRLPQGLKYKDAYIDAILMYRKVNEAQSQSEKSS